MENKWIDFIEKYKKDIDFTGGISMNDIENLEKELGLQLPEDYKVFLFKYGHGGLFGVEILGYGLSNNPPVLKTTLRYRGLGLLRNLVVIENNGEFLTCIDVEKNNIVNWYLDNQQVKVIADNFSIYLIENLEEGKEVWEEDF